MYTSCPLSPLRVDAAVTLDSTFYTPYGPTTRVTTTMARQSQETSARNSAKGKSAKYHTYRRSARKSTQAIGSVQNSRTLQKPTMRSEAKQQAHKALDRIIGARLLEQVARETNNGLATTWKRTTVHQSRTRSMSCKVATADWQLAMAIRKTTSKPVKQQQGHQAKAKPPVTGANAIPIPDSKQRWGQKKPNRAIIVLSKQGASVTPAEPTPQVQRVQAMLQEAGKRVEEKRTQQESPEEATRDAHKLTMKRIMAEIRAAVQRAREEYPIQEPPTERAPAHPFSDKIVRAEEAMPPSQISSKKDSMETPQAYEEQTVEDTPQPKVVTPRTWEKSPQGEEMLSVQGAPPKKQKHVRFEEPLCHQNKPTERLPTNKSLTMNKREAAAQELHDELVKTARLRATGSNVYMSARKSMTIRFYVHSVAKRVEAIALVDSGATENFMSLAYARWLKLPIKRMGSPRKLFNVDGTENKSGNLEFYTDLSVRTGTATTQLRFFLSDLGEHRAILGYPWFAAVQPNIDWKKGWIDHAQLPIIMRAENAKRANFAPRTQNAPRPAKTDQYYMCRATIHPTQSKPRNVDHQIPKEYARHEKVFSEEQSQRLPQHTIWDHAIELLPDAPATLPARLIPLHQKEKEEMHKFVAEHLKRGTIRESWSPYAASFFFIKKKDGKLRPVQDYRPINKWTKKNRNVSPLIPQTIDRLSGCTLFTKFDVRWGYNNVRIQPGDEWKAAFLTPEGLFEPTVMFFGLTNSPATFQMMMNTIFRREVAKGWLSVYMDDIAIHTTPHPGETDEQHTARHRLYTHHILDVLEKNDLYLKPEKCEFEKDEIEYLGVIVGRNSLRMDPKKLQAVASWPVPRNPTGVRQFLGFTGYYRYFVPNYSKIARPLLELTRKTIKWHWDEPQTKAFEELKTRMCSKPVLTQPDYEKRFYLQTDASAYGVGAVLSQEGKTSPTLAKRSKPVLHPISYYSATFTPTERNYDIYERELLAVMKALAHWRSYLGWTKVPFTILTDHANLQYWKAPRNLNRRTARWHADLQEYDYEIQHIPGKANTTADALSRPPDADQGGFDNQGVTIIPSLQFKTVTATTTTGEPPNEGRKRSIMALVHDHSVAGHPGRDETIRKAKQHLLWEGMNQWIADYVKGCATCQQNKILTHKTKVPLYRIPTEKGALPFQRIAMDLITGLPVHNGKDAILTVVDHGCSRAAVFLPCTTTITGPGIAQLYMDHIYRWFGLPTKVISDRDPRFTSHFGRALSQKLGIQQNLSTAFHPQTDGLSERKNQWVEQYLRLVTSASPEDWTHWMAIATAVHNNRRNATTGLSPNEVLFGYEAELIPKDTPPANNEAAQQRAEALTEKRAQAIDAINEAAKTGKTIPSQFRVGDQVWLEATHLKLRYQKTKLAPKRYGPFKVTKEISPVAYQVMLPTSWGIHNVFHASLLSPYHETTAHGPNFSRPPPDLIEGEEEYEVERVVHHRNYGRARTLQYLVKWKGYPDSDNTWEPADQVHAPELIEEYHRRQGKANKSLRQALIRAASNPPFISLPARPKTLWPSAPALPPCSPTQTKRPLTLPLPVPIHQEVAKNPRGRKNSALSPTTSHSPLNSLTGARYAPVPSDTGITAGLTLPATETTNRPPPSRAPSAYELSHAGTIGTPMSALIVKPSHDLSAPSAGGVTPGQMTYADTTRSPILRTVPSLQSPPYHPYPHLLAKSPPVVRTSRHSPLPHLPPGHQLRPSFRKPPRGSPTLQQLLPVSLRRALVHFLSQGLRQGDQCAPNLTRALTKLRAASSLDGRW